MGRRAASERKPENAILPGPDRTPDNTNTYLHARRRNCAYLCYDPEPAVVSVGNVHIECTGANARKGCLSTGYGNGVSNAVDTHCIGSNASGYSNRQGSISSRGGARQRCCD